MALPTRKQNVQKKKKVERKAQKRGTRITFKIKNLSKRAAKL